MTFFILKGQAQNRMTSFQNIKFKRNEIEINHLSSHLLQRLLESIELMREKDQPKRKEDERLRNDLESIKNQLQMIKKDNERMRGDLKSIKKDNELNRKEKKCIESQKKN